MARLLIGLYILYAAILLVGGIYGFLRAGSRPSLISGLLTAALIGAAAAILPQHPRAALALGAAISALVSILFIQRYRETKKAMPAAPVIAVSIVVLLASVILLAVALTPPGV